MDNTYNSIDLSKWTKVGEGGNGSVYTCPEQPGVILKVSHFKQTDGATETLADEFTRSKAVFDLGLPTPEMKEMEIFCTHQWRSPCAYRPSGGAYGKTCQAVSQHRYLRTNGYSVDESVDAGSLG